MPTEKSLNQYTKEHLAKLPLEQMSQVLKTLPPKEKTAFLRTLPLETVMNLMAADMTQNLNAKTSR